MRSHRIIAAAKTIDQLFNITGTLHLQFGIQLILIVALRIVLIAVAFDAFVRISETIIRTAFEMILTLNGNKMEHTIKMRLTIEHIKTQSNSTVLLIVLLKVDAI